MLSLDLRVENLDALMKLESALPEIVDQALQEVIAIARQDVIEEYSPVGERKQTQTKRGKLPRFKESWSAIEPVDGGYSFSNPVPYALVLEYGRYPGVGPKTVAARHATTGEAGIFSAQTVRGGKGGIVGRYLEEGDRSQWIADEVAKRVREKIEDLIT